MKKYLKGIVMNLVDEKYNGWKNYETWNVMLWINGTYELNKLVAEIVNRSSKTLTYKEVICGIGLDQCETPDGVAYISNKLSYKELNAAIREKKTNNSK